MAGEAAEISAHVCYDPGLGAFTLVLRRSATLPKHVWRHPATRRTLDPLDIAPLVQQALPGQPTASALEGNVIVDAEISQDCTHLVKLSARTSRTQREFQGALALTFTDGRVKLALNSEACRREVYTPRRQSRHLGALETWAPVRVILNGKAGWSSGRFYYLQDYHVILCDGPQPPTLRTARTFDLQEDLF